MKKILLILPIAIILNSCESTRTPGCTDTLAINYESFADYDDGSCVYIEGCTDPLANNYDPLAVVEPVNECQYSAPLKYYLDYSAVEYMNFWGISYYAFYQEYNGLEYYIGDLTSDYWWSSAPPNCLPENDGSALTTVLEWNGNYNNNTASFTWSAYPDDGPVADYAYTEILYPGVCVKLALSKKKIQEYKQSKN
mgnify:CR=1 FL=1